LLARIKRDLLQVKETHYTSKVTYDAQKRNLLQVTIGVFALVRLKKKRPTTSKRDLPDLLQGTIGVFALVGHGQEAFPVVLRPTVRAFIFKSFPVNRFAARPIAPVNVPPLNK
jgi:hypothetical protein